jgi:hypothetical protein
MVRYRRRRRHARCRLLERNETATTFKKRVEDALSGSLGGASLKLRVLKDGKVLPNDTASS